MSVADYVWRMKEEKAEMPKIKWIIEKTGIITYQNDACFVFKRR